MHPSVRALAVLITLWTCGLAAEPPVVAKFLQLFQRLRDADGKRTHGGKDPVSFQLTDGEINEYLSYTLRTTPRPGIDSVNMKIFPHNYISTFTVVDFDAIERWKPGTVPLVLRPVLNGKKSVWVDCRFQASKGTAVFSVEKAYYNDIRLPAFLVNRLIEIVAARQPEKYDTTKPVPLPFGLRQVSTTDHVVAGSNQ